MSFEQACMERCPALSEFQSRSTETDVPSEGNRPVPQENQSGWTTRHAHLGRHHPEGNAFHLRATPTDGVPSQSRHLPHPIRRDVSPANARIHSLLRRLRDLAIAMH